ncbi:rhodanese-like domain-containing protein [Marimonas lutisalis]|uniref:rhodanese-like domain-containing protein n=1 Tax=Marimonas lutisalis TaxID=2545756 RepID=UPI0010F6BFED|nr:rhodanese-like domain-containing protein [Marimonas lutisalis]
MKPKSYFCTGIAALAISAIAGSVHSSDIPRSKKTIAGYYLTATEAGVMLQSEDVLFVDVRTRAEVNFLGMPTRANVNIPFMTMPETPKYNASKGGYNLEVNEEFADMFLDYVTRHGHRADTPIILICRSGSRSAKAANILTDMGFAKVYSVVDGFEGDKAAQGPQKGQRTVNGWRNAGLDWRYSISEAQVYPDDVN